jgi:D-glycero-D-manno-heptose 1,7-bisphosphate phosphatase
MARPETEAAAERRFAVFLDRDGVLNPKPPEGEYVRTVADFALLPGVPRALRELQSAGATLFVVTNQRGVARGLVDAGELDRIHGRLRSRLADEGVELAGIYVCPHERDVCNCRKPEVGLFLRAQAEHPWIDFAASDLVGDAISDARAGHTLGVRTWIVGEDRDRVTGEAASDGVAIAGSAASLAELVADPTFRAEVGVA